MFHDYEKQKPAVLSDYIRFENGGITSPEHLWLEVQKKFSRAEILDFIGGLIREHDLDFPFVSYDKGKLINNFQTLKSSNPLVVSKTWGSYRIPDTVKCEYLGEPYLINIDMGRSFNGLSNAFLDRLRYEASYKGGVSPIEYWGQIKNGINPRFFTPLFMNPYLNKKQLRGCFENSAAIRTVTQFKPSIAKALYSFFNAKNVLDFCSGWGDRLVGYLASNAEHYIGIDPNTKLHKPYRDMIDFYDPDKKVTLFNLPAEDVDYSSLTYDFVFTSPPYFNLENYSREDTQSIMRHPNLKDWKNDFFFYTLRNVYEGLDHGGRMVINISDFDSGKVQICSEMIEFMSSLGATYEGCIGYAINPSQAVKKLITVTLAEPMFVWSKGEAPKPKFIPDNFFGV